MFSIYSKDLVLKANIKDYTSLRWRRRYFSPGEFEIHLLPDKKVLDNLEIDDIVIRKYSKESGVVESISITDDDVVIFGRFLSSFLDRRITYGRTNISAPSESIMRYAVNDNCIASRPLPRLALGTVKGFVDTIDIQYSWKNVLTTLEKISRKSNLGFGVYANIPQKTMSFEVYQGLDRSINQMANPRAIFSVERNNLNGSEYVISQVGHKNMAVIGGEGEGELRVITKINDELAGYDRREVFIDARDLQRDELSEEDYIKTLVTRGYEKLSEVEMFESFDCNISIDGSLEYKTDFDLGDIVTCIKKDWNKIMNVRISEVEESIQDGVISLTATLGSPLPSNENIREEE